MARFVPCQGKQNCRELDGHCLTCGRDISEIEQLRQLLDQLAGLAICNAYENVEEYSAYISGKLRKIITHRLENS